MALLTCTAYRRVSPVWLKWLLLGCGMLVLSRYLTMTLLTHPEAPQRFFGLWPCWFSTAVGFMLPSVFAVDALLKHPALTPTIWLQRVSPFLVVAIVSILAAGATPVPDALGGWTVRLGTWGRISLALTEGLFAVGFIGLCVVCMRKISDWPIRKALGGLVLAYGALGMAQLCDVLGSGPVGPILVSEMLTGLALWYAYDTSHATP